MIAKRVIEGWSSREATEIVRRSWDREADANLGAALRDTDPGSVTVPWLVYAIGLELIEHAQRGQIRNRDSYLRLRDMFVRLALHELSKSTPPQRIGLMRGTPSLSSLIGEKRTKHVLNYLVLAELLNDVDAIIWLHHSRDKTVTEIEQLTGIPERTVRDRLAKLKNGAIKKWSEGSVGKWFGNSTGKEFASAKFGVMLPLIGLQLSIRTAIKVKGKYLAGILAKASAVAGATLGFGVAIVVGASLVNPPIHADTDADGIADQVEDKRGTNRYYRDNFERLDQPETHKCSDLVAVYQYTYEALGLPWGQNWYPRYVLSTRPIAPKKSLPALIFSKNAREPNAAARSTKSVGLMETQGVSKVANRDVLWFAKRKPESGLRELLVGSGGILPRFDASPRNPSPTRIEDQAIPQAGLGFVAPVAESDSSPPKYWVNPRGFVPHPPDQLPDHPAGTLPIYACKDGYRMLKDPALAAAQHCDELLGFAWPARCPHQP